MEKVINRERVHYIDIARGIAILLMVLGHILEVKTLGREIIFSFHMPLFIIVSGFFFSDRRSFRKLFFTLFLKILVPAFCILTLVNFINIFRSGTGIKYFISSSLHQVVLFYSWKNDGEGILWDYPFGTGVMWFIALIFLIRIIYYFVNKLSKANILVNFGISGLMAVLGYYLSQKMSLWMPWSLDVVFSSLIFFAVGHLMALHQEKLKQMYQNWIFIGCLIVIWLFNVVEFKSLELAMRTYPQGFTSYITAILGTIIVLAVSYNCETKRCVVTKILIWFGENSLYILMAHHLESCVIDYAQLWSIKPLLFCVKILIVFVLANVIKFCVRLTGDCFRKLTGN